MKELLETIKDLLDKRTEITQLALGIIFCILLIFVFFYSWSEGDARGLWISVGLSATLLILLSDKRGASVFLAIMLVGTLVAREEFILEASAILTGEKLKDVRETRVASTPSLALTDSEESRLSQQLAELVAEAGNKSSVEVVTEITEAKAAFSIEADAKKLTDSSKAWIQMLAENGLTADENTRLFDRYFGSDMDTVDGWLPISAAGYVIAADVDDEYSYELTDQGKKLAETLGYSLVE